MSLTITADLVALSRHLNALQVKIDDAIRPAAQAAAQVLYEQVKNNVRVYSKGSGHWFYGTSFKKTGKKYWFDAGTLKKSIYQVYSKDKSNDKRAVYHIAWNHQECPYGFMVEFGTSKAAAKPFLRPALAKMGDALEAAKAEFLMRVNK